MNNYETLFVIKPTLTDEETTAQIAKVTAILEREGAEILAIDNMGMRKLAYPVQKNKRGLYTIIYFKAAGTIINELERNLKFNEEVIKYLTVRYSNTKEVAQFKKLVTAATKIEEATKAEETAKAEEAPEAEAPTTTTETVEA
ncbi:MAG TPA: 30S ribosomal protein S6 [Campylobacterales bacterium]|nr:30S ribosomal protein S6 [Campylobacterales bacterium]HIP42250.1 30S ribosomal protein S6 [Campylobacterales bacterium]